MTPEAQERRRTANREHMRRNREKGGDRESAARYREKHRETLRVRQKAWREANPAAMSRHRRKYWLKWNYGLTPEDVENMLAAQGFACAICGAEDPGPQGNWHTDHNHKTGKIRGILCHRCNVALGLAGDNPSTLDLMAQYARHHA